MRILTDFPKFPAHWKTLGVEGETRTTLKGGSLPALLKAIPDIRWSDVVLVHEGGSKVFWLAALFWIFPFLKKPLITVDLILRQPQTLKQRIAVGFKKILLRRVDHFILYFHALDGYQKVYGISPARCSYVPFKANIFGAPKTAESASPDPGRYVYTAGQSLRDFDTFFEAIAQLPYPAAIPRPKFERLHHHGARFTWPLEKLPHNVTILDDDGSPESWLKNLEEARLVVVPTLRHSLCASGIGTYLDAMMLKKCVIISSGPGVSEVLSDQVIIVPPEDPTALAQAIRRAWDDERLRSGVALRGYRYAVSLGGEPELMNRILEQVVKWSEGASLPRS